MTDNKAEPRDKTKRKNSSAGVLLSLFFFFSGCVCLSSFVCLCRALSACALLLCHPQGCVWRRPSADPFVSCLVLCHNLATINDQGWPFPCESFLLHQRIHRICLVYSWGHSKWVWLSWWVKWLKAFSDYRMGGYSTESCKWEGWKGFNLQPMV